MTSFQNVQITGTAGRVEIEIPFNAPVDRSCSIRIQRGAFLGGKVDVETFHANQYALQADDFSAAVEGNAAPATSLEDAARNIRVIEALFQSAEQGRPFSL